MKALFIYNPTVAKQSFTDNLDYIIEQFQARHIQLIFHRMNRLSALEEALQNAKKNECEFTKLIIAGDEFTINHVINLVVQYDIRLEIGIYPLGSFNSFVYQLGLHGNVQSQTKIILEGSPISCDVGKCNDQYFVNGITFGIFSEAIPIKIDSPSENFSGNVHMVFIFNTQSDTAFNKIGSSASLRDGLLDIYIFKKRPALNIFELWYAALLGKLKGDSNIITFQTGQLTLSAPKGTFLDINGKKSPEFPLQIESIPGRLRIMVDAEFEHQQNRKNYYLPMNIDMKPKISIPSAFDLADVILNMPYQHMFHYGNRNSLSPNYFEYAKASLDDPYLYIILSNTGSPGCNLISQVTGKKYGHISLAFDKELVTLTSFNGGNGENAPGLNPEVLTSFYQKPDASIMIFRIKATKQQKLMILRELKRINQVGSSYNFTGILLKRNFLSNMMFCSQFVYLMLEKAGLLYFEKNPNDVSPFDFLQHNEKGLLEFISEINLGDIL